MNFKCASFVTQAMSFEEIEKDFYRQKEKLMWDSTPSLALIFIAGPYQNYYPKILNLFDQIFQPTYIAGSSTSGVISIGKEHEEEPAISVLLLSHPQLKINLQPVNQRLLDESSGPGFWHYETECSPESTTGILVFADPFSIRTSSLVEQLSHAYPEVPIVGGLATSSSGDYKTFLFSNQLTLLEGALLVFFENPIQLTPVISQACIPIGKPLTITNSQENIIHRLNNQTALSVLSQLFAEIDESTRKRLRNNLYLGFAVDRYNDELKHGDFIIHHLIGLNEDTGSIALGVPVKNGQIVQFHMRDPVMALADLNQNLKQAQLKIHPAKPQACLLCLCNGRGTSLFIQAHQDTLEIEKILGSIPISGFICNGEIGPLGNRAFVQGYTASLALFYVN